jgi:hypothetical protein
MSQTKARKGKIARAKLESKTNRVLIAEAHKRADYRVKTDFLICIIVMVASVAITLVFHYPTDTVLAQVTIIPGTDNGGGSEEFDDGAIEEEEEEESSSSSDEITSVPFQSFFADTLTSNARITQSINYSHLIPLTNSPGDQLKVIVDYLVTDPSTVGESINAVMEMFSVSNQSLIKISSFPNPIIANASGTVQLATTFPDNSVIDVVSLITFTDAEKEIALSDPLTLTLKLGQSSS